LLSLSDILHKNWFVLLMSANPTRIFFVCFVPRSIFSTW
jgi:hypothetical protein